MTGSLPTLAFGACQLKLATRELTVDGELIDLQPLVFDLLAFFAQNPGRVIGKDELLNAVWRSPFVTDSVVTRAVMKARRAIMDDARNPQLLQTVQRAGYRFTAQATRLAPTPDSELDRLAKRAPTQAMLDLVILPLQSDDQSVHALGGQVASLIHHFLEREARLALLPMADVFASWDRLQPEADQLAAACRMFGAREALLCQWRPEATGGWEFVLRRGAAQGQSTEWCLPGGVFWLRAWQGILSLTTTDSSTRQLAPSPAALQALGEALLLDHTGPNPEALTRLMAALPLWPASGWLSFAQVRISQRVGKPVEGLQWATQALDALDARSQPVLRARLLSLQGLCRENCDDLAGACDSLAQAVELAGDQPALACHRPDFLGWWALAAVRNGPAQRARQLAAQAVIEASALGVMSRLTAAKMHRGIVLTLLQQHDRAIDVIDQAIDMARDIRSRQLVASALRLKGFSLLCLRRYHEAAKTSREALAAARNPDIAMMASHSHNDLLASLIESDQLELAQQERHLLEAAGVVGAGNQLAFRFHTALLDWKLDRTDQALSTLQALTSHRHQRPSLPNRVHDHFLVNMLLCLQRLDEARVVLARMQDDPSPERALYAQAHLAFVEGRRAECVNGLRTIWRSVRGLGEDVMDAAIDLAWLLLEDQGPAQGGEELESLVAHILDYSDSYPAAVLLSGAYLLRSLPSASSRARWDAAVLQARAFARRYPDLATRDFRDALEQGRAAPLPRLLTRMCQ